METRARFGAVPRTAVVITILGLLLAAFTAISLASGSAPPTKLPPPFGLARNGLIAYTSNGDWQVMDQHGEHRQALTSGPDLDYYGVWSPDGTVLAYWSVAFTGDLADQTAIDAATNGPNGSIKTVRADGSDIRTLATGLRWPSDCGTDLSWSPDSQQLAYAHQVAVDGVTDLQIEVVPVAGGEPRMVVRGGFTPTWSPDGGIDRICQPQLYRSRRCPPRRARCLTRSRSPAASPPGSTQTSGSGCAFNEPQWSSDGTQILFYQGADGYHDVWTANTDGSGEKALATEAPDEYWPRWSPDDSRIAFDRVVLSDLNAPQFVIMDPDGGHQVMLDHPTVAARYPTWSPDGTLLLGIAPTPDQQDTTGLMLIDVSGAEAPVTFETGKVWGDPTWQRLAIE